MTTDVMQGATMAKEAGEALAVAQPVPNRNVWAVLKGLLSPILSR